MDPVTDIVYAELDDPERWADSVQIAGRWYLPTRRHRRPSGLKTELMAAGFDVMVQDRGDLVCGHEDAGVVLS